MSVNGMRDGARHFSREARESVCAGDPFDWLHRGEFRRRSDERDLLAALLLAEGKAEAMKGLTAGGGYAATALGFDPEGYVGGRAIREISELGWLAGSGGCRTADSLRVALLGHGAAAPVPVAARPLDDDAAFSEEGC